MTFDIAPGSYTICAAPPARVEFKRGPITIRSIQEAVAEHYGISRLDLISNRRSRHIAQPRQLAMYLCRELTPHSYPSIGKHFGKRDHTTIMHGVKVVEERLEASARLGNDLCDLREALGA
jgi:chromosomal replication initiator protein